MERAGAFSFLNEIPQKRVQAAKASPQTFSCPLQRYHRRSNVFRTWRIASICVRKTDKRAGSRLGNSTHINSASTVSLRGQKTSQSESKVTGRYTRSHKDDGWMKIQLARFQTRSVQTSRELSEGTVLARWKFYSPIGQRKGSKAILEVSFIRT